MSFATYVLGGAMLLVAVGPIVWGAVRVRRRVLPSWVGAPARLFEAVVALSLTFAVCQLLGSVGGFRRGSVVAGLAVAGFALASAGRGRPAATTETHAGTEAVSEIGPATLGRTAVVVAVVAVAIVAGGWTTRIGTSISLGTDEYDSLWYHLPHAARFVREGSITELHYTDPDFPTAFHPSNSELLHAVGMLLFRSDVLSPFLNAGWAALALLAAWCVGRPFGVAPITMTAATLILASPLISIHAAGSANNDVPVLFFLLAAAALLLQPRFGRSQATGAAFAAGLAVGTKLTAVLPVAALTVGVLVLWRRQGWRRLTASWVVPLIATGAFWYARNLAHTGSPIPGLPLGAGPLPFSSPSFRIIDRFGYSVADYLGDRAVWRQWFLPGLRLDFGWAWWLTLALAATGAILAVLRGRELLVRVLGVVAAVGAVGYLMAPTTALGTKGQPLLFAGNVRYVTPALVLALVLLPLHPSLRRPAVAGTMLGIIAVALLVSQLTSELGAWGPSFRARGVAVAVLVAVAAVLGARLRGWMVAHRSGLAVILAVTILLAALAAFPVARNHVRNQYRADALWRWARTLPGDRIAIAGFAEQYPLYGIDLKNRVQYVGEAGPHGEFTPARDCASWRSALRRGGYTYVVLMPGRPTTDVVRRESPWTLSDPAARLILRVRNATVFRFDPQVPDPGCVGLG